GCAVRAERARRLGRPRPKSGDRPSARPPGSDPRRARGPARLMFRLDGRVAVITGGARGIGAETARVFREAGATVATWDVAEGADQRVDVTDAQAVSNAVAEVTSRHVRIDILVNNAGILRDALLIKLK